MMQDRTQAHTSSRPKPAGAPGIPLGTLTGPVVALYRGLRNTLSKSYRKDHPSRTIIGNV